MLNQDNPKGRLKRKFHTFRRPLALQPRRAGIPAHRLLDDSNQVRDRQGYPNTNRRGRLKIG
ncbi:hypothetical protein [Neisseria weaveri]|uniref:hypothetical protein n=1 Tax=Neisseria weaveri TaxID=28091 RepID=UPI00131D95A1|nr:hypothetical protein [Neisseria weaveri]